MSAPRKIWTNREPKIEKLVPWHPWHFVLGKYSPRVPNDQYELLISRATANAILKMMWGI